MIVGFVVCWTPYFVISLIRIYSDYRYRLNSDSGCYSDSVVVNSGNRPVIAPPCSNKSNRYRLTTALSVSELMALGHSAINPLLYIVFSTCSRHQHLCFKR